MFDPVKNAKVVGFLIVLLTLLGVAAIYGFGEGVSFTPLAIVLTLASLVVAYGLIKTKLWGVYGLGLLGLISLVQMLISFSSGEQVTVGSWVTLAFYAALFFWFFSSRNKFSKK